MAKFKLLCVLFVLVSGSSVVLSQLDAEGEYSEEYDDMTDQFDDIFKNTDDNDYESILQKINEAKERVFQAPKETNDDIYQKPEMYQADHELQVEDTRFDHSNNEENVDYDIGDENMNGNAPINDYDNDENDEINDNDDDDEGDQKQFENLLQVDWKQFQNENIGLNNLNDDQFGEINGEASNINKEMEEFENEENIYKAAENINYDHIYDKQQPINEMIPKNPEKEEVKNVGEEEQDQKEIETLLQKFESNNIGENESNLKGENEQNNDDDYKEILDNIFREINDMNAEVQSPDDGNKENDVGNSKEKDALPSDESFEQNVVNAIIVPKEIIDETKDILNEDVYENDQVETPQEILNNIFNENIDKNDDNDDKQVENFLEGILLNNINAIDDNSEVFNENNNIYDNILDNDNDKFEQDEDKEIERDDDKVITLEIQNIVNINEDFNDKSSNIQTLEITDNENGHPYLNDVFGEDKAGRINENDAEKISSIDDSEKEDISDDDNANAIIIMFNPLEGNNESNADQNELIEKENQDISDNDVSTEEITGDENEKDTDEEEITIHQLQSFNEIGNSQENVFEKNDINDEQENETAQEKLDGFISENKVEIFDDFSEFENNPIKYTLSLDKAVVVTSPNYPEPYKNIGIIDWYFSGDAGTGIELNITSFDVDGNSGDYLLLKPGKSDISGDDGIILTYSLKQERRFRFFDVDDMYVRFESKGGNLQNCAGFQFSVKLIQPKSDRAHETVPNPEAVSQVPEETLTIFLSGFHQHQDSNVTQQFRNMLVDMVAMYAAREQINDGEAIAENDVQLLWVAACNVAWPDSQSCAAVTFGVILNYEDSQYELSAEQLGEMWTDYNGVDPFAVRLRLLGISEYLAPNERAVISSWMLASLLVLILVSGIGLAIFRWNCFKDYDGMTRLKEDTDSIGSGRKSSLSLYPTPHQNLSPMFADEKYDRYLDGEYRPDNDTTRVDMGGAFNNKSFVRDGELMDLDSDEEIVMSLPDDGKKPKRQSYNSGIRPRDVYEA